MTEFERDRDCLVCGPGVHIEVDPSVTLQKVIFQLPIPEPLKYIIREFSSLLFQFLCPFFTSLRGPDQQFLVKKKKYL